MATLLQRRESKTAGAREAAGHGSRASSGRGQYVADEAAARS